MANVKQPSGYRTLPADAPIWVTEPFRIFFPLGIAASTFGVLIWPLFYTGAWPFPPQIQHPRIMIFGFGSAFVAGFLGTAWPRFLGAEALRRGELFLLVLTWVGAQLCYALFRIPVGDLIFACHALTLLTILSLRVRRNRELPPPGFALAFASVTIAFAVALTWGLAFTRLPPELLLLSKLLVSQAVLLLPLLGVGSYLFARFFQIPGERPPAACPARRLRGVWFATVVILISFVIEVNAGVRWGNLVRFGGLVNWAILAVPFIWRGRAPNTRAWALRMALGSVAISFLWRGISPGPGYAVEHILFLGGFGLAMLLTADRVTLGHADVLPGTPPRSKLWRWLVWLNLLAAATRVSADFKASILISHHIYAALLWSIITGLWTVALARHWRCRSHS